MKWPNVEKAATKLCDSLIVSSGEVHRIASAVGHSMTCINQEEQPSLTGITVTQNEMLIENGRIDIRSFESEKLLGGIFHCTVQNYGAFSAHLVWLRRC